MTRSIKIINKKLLLSSLLIILVFNGCMMSGMGLKSRSIETKNLF